MFVRHRAVPWFAGLTVAGLVACGTWYFVAVWAPAERRASEARWETLLSTMAADRAAAVARWASDRLGAAAGIAAYPTVRYLLDGEPPGPKPFPVEEGPGGHLNRLLTEHVRSASLAAGYVVAADGSAVGASEGARPLDAECRAAIHAAIETGRPAAEFHRHEDGAAVVAFVAPLVIAGRAAGAALLVEAPESWLYPFLRTDPASASSAETVMVRREGEVARFLVPLRHCPDPPLTFTRPLSVPGFAAFAALEGNRPTGRYVDYRRVPVLAAARPVPGTSWGMVVKVDEAEAFAEVDRRLRATGGAAATTLLALLAVGAGAWRHQRASDLLAAARARARFSALVDQANDAVLSVSLDGRILDANRRAEEMYGRGRGELRTLTVADLRPPETRSEVSRNLATALDQGSVVFETLHLRGDGTPFPVEVSSRRVADEGGDTLLSIVRDVSARKAAEQRIATLNRLLRTISEVNQLIVRERDPERLLAETCRIVVEHGGVRMAWIGRTDRSTGEVRPVASAGASEGYLEGIRVRVDDSPSGRGPTGAAIREGRAQVVQDWEADERMAPWRERAREHGFRSSAALPIRVHEQVAGALSVYAGEAGAFDPEVVALLEELAADLGYALAGIETEKLRADAATALAASEANYRRIVETASEGIWAMNADLRTTFVNRCAAAMLGFDPGEMLGRAYEEFMFPDQLADHEARMTERRRGETGLYERRFRRKDGGECWCIVSATALRDGEGRFAGSFAMLTDITGRKRAEAALADSEERLRLALEASGQGMFDWDIATGRIAWSEGHERLWGLEPGTFDGSFETFRRGVHPDDIAELEAALGAARASRSAYAHEFRVVRPDGSRRWVFGSGRFYYDRAGAPVRMCGVVTDVTARHEAEAALHEADRRRAEILESVTDGFVALDLESRYTYVNTRAGEMIGRRPEELLGRHIWTVFPEGVGQPIHQALERALATQEPAQIEAYFEPWDRWFENRIYPSAAGLTVYFVETTERRRAEQRLAEAEERHKLALEGGGLGSWDWNVVTGAVVFNERWAEMLGYTLDEIEPDVTVWEGLLHPDDRQRVAEVLEAHLRGETPHYETEHRLRHKTGGWVWVLDRGRVIERDAHGRALRACGTHLDITERRRAEQRLRESEERLRFALEASHVGGWDLDLVDHTAFRTLEHDRIFGYRTLLPKWTYEMFLDHVVPEDRAEVDRCFREATAAGTNWHFECRIRRVDDEVRWIWATGEHRLDGAGNVRRMAGIVQDITERKRAEEAQRTLAEQLERRVRDRTAELAANQAALEREVEERRWTQLALERAKSEVEDLYNRAPCGYHSLDEGGRIVAINDTELEWLGRGREDVVGTLRFQDLLTPASREVFAANFPGFKERGWVRDLEFELVRADGSTFWVLLNASAIRDQLGRYVASRSTTFDITAKKAVEDRARQLALLAQQRATELEAANAELEAFAYSVSHDLRAPLRAIDGFSLALLEDSAAQLDEAGRGHLERVRAATQRMGRLIDDLLRLSRVTRHDLQRGPVDLARLAREVIAELAAQEPGRRVDVTVAGEMAADADPHLMRILLVNLLGNAWKFTARVEEPAIAFTVARHPGAVPAYSVSDNGAGFDPAYAQRLFQPFQRLHGATEFPGSGIGLATAQRIVRRHGGRIWAVSEVGRGATFSFTLEPDAAALGAGMGVG